MRSLPFAFAITMTLAACGGDSTTKTGVDAPVTTQHDAPVTPTPDAPTSTAAMGLGKVCGDATHTCPATGATMCVKLSSTATLGFCTLPCGTTTKPATGNPTPPVGGDAMCTASTPAPGAGTPACVLDAVTGTTVNWDCGIECGMSGTTNLGGCPMGLTCTMNICQ